jgi:hypothetical protein
LNTKELIISTSIVANGEACAVLHSLGIRV